MLRKSAHEALKRLTKMTEAGLHGRPVVEEHIVKTDTGFEVVSSAGRLPISKKGAMHIYTQLRHHAKSGHLR
jgi:hypothetical protein